MHFKVHFVFPSSETSLFIKKNFSWQLQEWTMIATNVKYKINEEIRFLTFIYTSD